MTTINTTATLFTVADIASIDWDDTASVEEVAEFISNNMSIIDELDSWNASIWKKYFGAKYESYKASITFARSSYAHEEIEANIAWLIEGLPEDEEEFFLSSYNYNIEHGMSHNDAATYAGYDLEDYQYAKETSTEEE